MNFGTLKTSILVIAFFCNRRQHELNPRASSKHRAFFRSSTFFYSELQTSAGLRKGPAPGFTRGPKAYTSSTSKMKGGTGTRSRSVPRCASRRKEDFTAIRIIACSF